MHETIGDYRLIDKIGEGAAGEVFIASPLRDKSFAASGQPIAIKRYKPAILKQAHQFERIEREFDVGSTLSHPNLVRIFEYSQACSENPTPYLVMEYVDGIPLDEWIGQFHPLPRRLLLRFAQQLASAVQHLHENDVLHRDLKPQNIMVTSTFDVKVMDFGVVHVRSDTPITPDDKFLGTIRNSSPEMLLGNKYDHRTDLYSLGTVFFALLHGEQVFSDEEQFVRLTRLIEKKVPQFDHAIKSQDEVAESLFGITERLLKKNPDDRFSNAADVIYELDRVCAKTEGTEATEPLHGYVATALTGLKPDARDAIMFASSRIAEIAKQFDLYVYQPRKATDPLLHKDVEASAVYRLDRNRVVAADLLIVIANQPSFGVGQEIEIATGHSIPTILLVREGTSVSRMVTGSPANILDEIFYSTPEELDRKLRKSLTRNVEKLRQRRRLSRGDKKNNVGHRLAIARKKAGFASSAELAEEIGVSPRLIQAVEHGDYETASLDLIDGIAEFLGTSLHGLLGSATPRSVEKAPRVDANVRRLENTAKRLSWSAGVFLELRDDYQRQLAASGEPGMIAEEQWVARHGALDKRRLRESAESDVSQKSFLSQSE